MNDPVPCISVRGSYFFKEIIILGVKIFILGLSDGSFGTVLKRNVVYIPFLAPPERKKISFPSKIAVPADVSQNSLTGPNHENTDLDVYLDLLWHARHSKSPRPL